MRMQAVSVVLLVAVGVAWSNGDTCTTFCADDGDRVVFGKNYDWSSRPTEVESMS